MYALLQAAEIDMTLFFRALADVDLDGAVARLPLRATRSTTTEKQRAANRRSRLARRATRARVQRDDAVDRTRVARA